MSESEPQYVLLADVVGSSDIDDRAAFRESLTRALDRVNREFSEYLSSEFEMLKGIDEFGGVLSRLAPVYDIVSMIYADIHPTMVRFGVSGGRIDIQPSGEINELDGPAFHQADDLLTQVEADDLFMYINTETIVDVLVSNNINLLLMNRATWTARQNEIVQAYEDLGSQTSVAERLDINQQAVSKALDRVSYSQTKLLREYLREVISVIYDG